MFKGVKKASSATKQFCNEDGYGWQVNVVIDRVTKEVFYWEHPAGNVALRYNNPNILWVFKFRRPAKMAEVQRMCEDALQAYDALMRMFPPLDNEAEL